MARVKKLEDFGNAKKHAALQGDVPTAVAEALAMAQQAAGLAIGKRVRSATLGTVWL